jgi:hypothetical protein
VTRALPLSGRTAGTHSACVPPASQRWPYTYYSSTHRFGSPYTYYYSTHRFPDEGRRARIPLHLHIQLEKTVLRGSWSAFWLQKPSILRVCVREEDAGGREAGAHSTTPIHTVKKRQSCDRAELVGIVVAETMYV